jgi:hypothetical protein
MSNGIVSSITRAGQYEPFDLQVGRGQILGHGDVAIFGYTAAAGNVEQTIWEGSTTGGTDYVFPSAASQMTMVSTSTSDTSALMIQINGLDANFNLLSENIAMNGTTAVTTVNSYLRINSLYVTNGTNVGTITAKVSSTVYAQINPGIGQTQMAVFTVPAGYTFFKTYTEASTSLGSSQYMTLRTYSYYNLAGVRTVNGYKCNHQNNTVVNGQTAFNGPITSQVTVPFGYPAGTDIKFQVVSSGGGVNGAVSVAVYGYLVQSNTTTTQPGN